MGTGKFLWHCGGITEAWLERNLWIKGLETLSLLPVSGRFVSRSLFQTDWSPFLTSFVTVTHWNIVPKHCCLDGGNVFLMSGCLFSCEDCPSAKSFPPFLFFNFSDVFVDWTPILHLARILASLNSLSWTSLQFYVHLSLVLSEFWCEDYVISKDQISFLAIPLTWFPLAILLFIPYSTSPLIEVR